MKIKISLDFKDISVNRVIKHFIISDLLFLGSWGFVSPIFAIFVMQKISGATLSTVGLSVGIYYIAKSLVQLPIAIKLDKKKGEKESFYTLIGSLMFAGFSAIAYCLVDSIDGLYVVSALQGAAFGLYTPAWSGMFSKHLDKDHCSLDWSLDSTTTGMAYGVAAIFGGLIANTFGFLSVFVFSSILSFVAALTLLTVPHLIFPRAQISHDTIINQTHI